MAREREEAKGRGRAFSTVLVHPESKRKKRERAGASFWTSAFCAEEFIKTTVSSGKSSKNTTHIWGGFRDHPNYPHRFHFATSYRRAKCPKHLVPHPDTLKGVDGVNHSFLGQRQQTDTDSETESD